jgi:hypothetical protein
MDFFFLEGPSPVRPPQNKKPAVRKSGSALVKLKGLVVLVRDKSILFFDDGSAREVFIPVRSVVDWWFISDGSKRGLRLTDLELNDEISVIIPIWLAKKEKML